MSEEHASQDPFLVDGLPLTLLEIKECWDSESLWDEKQEVFDFMLVHFGRLLDLAIKAEHGSKIP